MIKENELRLGNLIYENGVDYNSAGNQIIDPSDKSVTTALVLYNETINNDDYTMFSPIPLTEEWLLRLGATKLESDITQYAIGFNHDGEDYAEAVIISLGSNNNWYVLAGRRIDAPFVHVLQNFVFANYGEELTLKQ